MKPFNINYAQLVQLSRKLILNETIIKELQYKIKTLTERVNIIETSKRIQQCKNSKF